MARLSDSRVSAVEALSLASAIDMICPSFVRRVAHQVLELIELRQHRHALFFVERVGRAGSSPARMKRSWRWRWRSRERRNRSKATRLVRNTFTAPAIRPTSSCLPVPSTRAWRSPCDRAFSTPHASVSGVKERDM